MPLTTDTDADTATLTIACFAQGTRIARTSGEVVVEDLRVGDRVLTVGGGVRPIRWIGRRHIDPMRHPKPGCVLPVCVRRDAFGEGRLMDLEIAGRTAIVCGSSRGLGLACAEAPAAEGVDVVISGRKTDDVAATVAAINAKGGGRAQGVVGDVTSPEGRVRAGPNR